MISRINHGLKKVPSINHYTIEDPESPFKPLIITEKPKPFTYNNLINFKNWIHYPPDILKCSRVSHIIPEEEPEDIEWWF